MTDNLKNLIAEARSAALAARLGSDVSKAAESALAKAIELHGQSGSGAVSDVCMALLQEQELLRSERAQARLLLAKHRHALEQAVELGDADASAQALQNAREQKDRIKAVTHELKTSVEELRSKLASIALGVAE